MTTPLEDISHTASALDTLAHHLSMVGMTKLVEQLYVESNRLRGALDTIRNLPEPPPFNKLRQALTQSFGDIIRSTTPSGSTTEWPWWPGTSVFADRALDTLDKLGVLQHPQPSTPNVAELQSKVAQLQEQLAEAERVLEDFAVHGTRYDTQPTRRHYLCGEAQEVDRWWLDYFAEADKNVRTNAKSYFNTKAKP